MDVDTLHNFTLGDVVRNHARHRPAATAVVDGEVRLTWPELDERVNRLANALIADGVGQGDVVLWLGQNSFRILECLLAAAKIGAVCCVANWRQSADEMAFVIGDASARVVIWQEAEVGEVVRAGRAAAPHGADAPVARWLRHDTDPSEPDSYEAFLAAGDPADPNHTVSATVPVLMLYTAAFSGTPNGALLSSNAVIIQSLMMANLQRIDDTYRYLNSGPLFHVATFMTTLATLLFGGVNLFTPRVDAAEICRLIQSECITGAFIMGPTIAEILTENSVDDSGARRWDLSTLRTFGGAPEWNELITVDDSPWGRHPAGFGQTEVMGMLTFNALGVGGAGGAGRPSPVVSVRILDPDGNEVRPGETGEISARGPQVMTGYHRRVHETDRRQAGGWHHTNDLGRIEADGTLSFVGPKGRLIKSAAENIYPAEVEAALGAHPAVREAAVVGVPDSTWGQSVTAIVVVHDDQDVTESELIDFVKGRIASYKKPRTVVFRDTPLPRHGWPIDYDTLDAEYGGGAYPGTG